MIRFLGLRDCKLPFPAVSTLISVTPFILTIFKKIVLVDLAAVRDDLSWSSKQMC